MIFNYLEGEYYYKLYFENTIVLGTIAALYIPTIFGIQYVMKTQQPFKNTFSNYLLFGWNMCLSTGSCIGAYYLLPYVYNDIVENGLTNSICLGNFRTNDIASHVIILFNLSKFAEFVDTLFIVFRKSKLEFLHYYHHILTCLYCWNSGYLATSTGIYFSSINLFIHSLMYFYYALLAIDVKILTPYKKCITLIQTTQMVLGTYVICSWFLNCSQESDIYSILNHVVGLGMYISYGYLFSNILFSSTPLKKRLE